MHKKIRWVIKRIALAVAVIVFVLFAHWSTREVFHLYDIQKLNRAAASASQGLDAEEMSLLWQSRRLEASPTIFKYIQGHSIIQLLAALDEEVKNTGLGGILVVDQNGVVLTRSNDISKANDYIYDTTIWGQRLAAGKSVSSIVVGRSWPLVIIASQPLVENGKVLQSIVPEHLLNDGYAASFKAQYLGQGEQITFLSQQEGALGDSFTDQESKKLIARYFNVRGIQTWANANKETKIGGQNFLIQQVNLPSLDGSVGTALIFIQADHTAPSIVVVVILGLLAFLYLRRLRPKKSSWKLGFAIAAAMLVGFVVNKWVLDAATLVLKPAPFLIYNSTLELNPSFAVFDDLSEQTFAIQLYTGGEAVNAAQVILNYDPAVFQVEDFLRAHSFCSPDLFVEKKIDNKHGQVSIICGLPNPGFQERMGVVAELSVKMLKVGQFDLNFGNDTQILANDGLGTNVLRMTTGGHYSISEPGHNVRVFSSSHPNSNQWYQDKNIEVSWGSDQPRQYAYSLSQNPDDIPSRNTATAQTKASFHVDKEGIYYFHLLPLSQKKAEKVINYQIKIDATPPAVPVIKVSNMAPVAGEVVRFQFSSTDKIGDLIQAFYVKLDDSTLLPVGGAFAATFNKAGKHTITVRIYDKANNFSESSLTLNVGK
jgi:hypothetical protein